MISYEVYKVLHLSMIFLFLSQIAATLLGNRNDVKTKILTGVSSFLILVAGMGLLARIGVSHKAGWPAWAYAKLAIWLVVSALGPIAAKRLGGKKGVAFYVILVLAVCAAYLAVNKPW